jgi:hypothetical protein
VFDLVVKHGPKAEYLSQMVDAATWVELHEAVRAQVALHAEITSGEAEG